MIIWGRHLANDLLSQPESETASGAEAASAHSSKDETASGPAPEAAGGDAGPLRDVLARKRAVLLSPEAQQAFEIRAGVTAESRSGVRRLRIRDFQYISDSGRDYAGYALGAGSWPTFAAVLASAVAEEFVIQAAFQGIPIDALDVVFTSDPDAPDVAQTHKVPYPRNLAYVAYIDSPATDAELEGLRHAVEAVSPALNVVRDNQLVGRGTIDLTASAAEPAADAVPGLRDFLVEKRQAILRRDAEREAGTLAPLGGHRAHARVEPRTGIRDTRVGSGAGFQILHDDRPGQLSHGLAPSAEEHLVGVLGTCLTHIFEIQAARKEIPLDALEIRLEAKLSPRVGNGTGNPPRFEGIGYTAHIETPASSAQVEDLRDAVEGACPVYNLLKDSQPISGRILRERYRT